MAQKIIIKESELRDLVEGALNDLDWRTYANAARKAYDDTSDPSNGKHNLKRFIQYLKFGDAANKNFRKTSAMIDRSDISPDFRPAYTNVHIRDNYAPDDIISYHYNNPERIRDMCDYRYLHCYTPKSYDKTDRYYQDLVNRHPNLKDIDDYASGKAKYKDGKWGVENESLIRSITESVIHLLKRR